MAFRHPPHKKPKPATIKTVADAVGVSPSTVSRAFQPESRITEETRKRVLEAADRLDYRRDLRGVNLRTGRSFTLCAVLITHPSREFGDPAAMHLNEGLIAGVEGTDFKVVLRPVESREQRFEAVREAVGLGRFDGLILDHTDPQDQAVLYLLEHRTRFVTFGRTELYSEHPYFDIDNEHAAWLATRRLIGLGHERIALIDPPEHFLFAAQRLAGYRAALEQAGLPFEETLAVHMEIGARRVRERVGAMLAGAGRPTGFVTVNEVSTLGAVAACRAALPAGELAATGFVSRDGTRLFDYFEPPVSSCYYPLLEAGRILARALVLAVEGAPVEELQRVERVRLVERPAGPAEAAGEPRAVSAGAR